MKLFIPPLKTKIRLTAPLTFTLKDLSRLEGNTPQMFVWWKIMRPGVPWDYTQACAMTDFELPEGTVLSFKRYFISAHAHQNRVDVSIWAHPRRDLTPRKQGGTGDTLTLELPLKILNRIEYEEVVL